MKLLSFTVNHKSSWGAVVDNTSTGGIVDLAAKTGYATLRQALAVTDTKTLASLTAGVKPDYALSDVSLLPVIPDPDKIICIGVNYHDHRIETGREETLKPTVFSRFPSSQVGHGSPILRPPESIQLDYEGEIAVIIGKRGRRISQSDSWSHIAGYAPYCEGTIRDWQRHTSQWLPGKSFANSGAFGPWMVTRDEIADGADLSLVTRLNGVEVQRTSASLMIFSIPEIIEYCSTFTEILPGDVIVSGTPGGVGGKRTPPLWMKHGDVVEIEVGQVGILRNPIQDEGVSK